MKNKFNKFEKNPLCITADIVCKFNVDEEFFRQFEALLSLRTICRMFGNKTLVHIYVTNGRLCESGGSKRKKQRKKTPEGVFFVKSQIILRPTP